MLLPPLCTQSDYVNFAKEVGFKLFSEPFDISKEVAKTWYVAKLPACCYSSIHAALEYANESLQGHLLGPYPITSTVGFRLDARSGRTGFLPII
jgi:hypothetical protein